MAGVAGGGAPTTGPGVLLWRAVVDDQTGDFFVQFEGNLKKLTAGSNAAFQNVTQQTGRATRSLSIMVGIFVNLTAAVMRFTRQAISGFTDFIGESIKLAARVETLQVVMYQVGNNVGYSRKELDALEKSVKANGITTRATRQIISQMAEAQLDLAASVELTRIAQDAAVIADLNSSDAAMRLIHGITTLNPLVLRRLGIIVSLDQAYQKYADTLGITIDDLSSETKQQIALNAVLEKGKTIAGAYDEAMGTVGKKMNSLARFVEELQIRLGRVFTPALGFMVDDLIASLEELTKWFDDNEENVDRWGKTLLANVTAAYEMVDKLAKAISAVPEWVVGAEAGALEMMGAIKPEETQSRIDNLWTAFRQYMAMYSALAALGAKVILDSVQTMTKLLLLGGNLLIAAGELVRAGPAGLTDFIGKFEELGEQADDVRKQFEYDAQGRTFFDRLNEDSIRFMKTSLEIWGFIPEVVADAGDAAAKAWAERLKLIEVETVDTVDKIIDLNRRMAKEYADLAKQELRDQIDEDIRNSRRREDIERRHQKNIEGIYRDYEEKKRDLATEAAEDEQEVRDQIADKRAEAEKDYNRKLIDIEIEYQRELEDIKREAWDTIEEAARSNDAVAVAKAFRDAEKKRRDAAIENKRDREDAKRDYDRDLEDIKADAEKRREQRKKDRAKELKDLEEDLQKELEEARRARLEDYEDLQLSLQREKEDKERHRAWDEEDRRVKWDAELKQLGAHLASLKYIDETAAKYLLEQHGQFYKDDLVLAQAYYDAKRRMAEDAANLGWGGGSHPPGQYEGPDWFSEEGMATGGVSMAMSPKRLWVGEREPELVAAMPLSRVVTHNINMRGGINVTGGAPGMDTSSMQAAIMDVLAQFGRSLLSRKAGY